MWAAVHASTWAFRKECKWDRRVPKQAYLLSDGMGSLVFGISSGGITGSVPFRSRVACSSGKGTILISSSSSSVYVRFPRFFNFVVWGVSLRRCRLVSVY